ncbi:hypothetical protein Tco_1068860 [Tanacetum coccineum]|uniref:Uncharacterized protein n=1 Tax=Tanacetum coccineum TaxID=301880 RepID=A0ABQ5HJ20_9ASTR
MEAQIRALRRDVDVLQRFRDLVRAADAGPHDGPADAGSSCYYLVWHAKYYGSLPASIALGQYFHFKMPPKRTAATTTPMTDSQIRALISQGVVDALAEHEANRSRNGDDNHDSRSDGRRRMPIAR